MNVIEATSLGKRYGDTWALRECTVAIPAGHVAALVGPNGAGKTTLLNLAVGLAEPTAGAVTVLGGQPAGSRAALDGIAFVAQDTPVYRNLSAADMLHLTRNLNWRFDQGYARTRLGELGIPRKRKAGKLSGGQQAQLALTLALARRPRLLVLDEPLANLDPVARHDFMATVMTAVAADGVSVLTALSTQARSGNGAGLRPVPWRRMAWVTWRQHRATLAGVAALLGALAAYLLITGLRMHHAYAAVAACHPASSLACSNASGDFEQAYWSTAEVIAALLQVVPALIGAFAAAPVLARELETGTFRYAWTQGFGRARWTIAKLVSLAATVAAAAGAFSAAFSWYFGPFFALGQQTPLAPMAFDLRGVAFAAWTLAAFAIGALASMLIRRVVPAIAATLAAWAGLALAAGGFLRQHYLPPVVTHNPNVPASAWIISHWYTGRNGKRLSQAEVRQILQAYHPAAHRIGPNTFQTIRNPVRYLAQHGYTFWVSYQPASRFWPFQWIEGGWLLGLSLLLIAATIWLVRRRAA